MELEDLSYYDPSWRIIVCKQCGVVPQLFTPPRSTILGNVTYIAMFATLTALMVRQRDGEMEAEDVYNYSWEVWCNQRKLAFLVPICDIPLSRTGIYDKKERGILQDRQDPRRRNAARFALLFSRPRWECDRFLLHDVIVGLWRCVEDGFREMLVCSAEKHYHRQESGFAAEDEIISQFLAEEVIVAGVRSPRLVEQVTMLTRSI